MDYKEKIKEAKRLYETANADQKCVLESLFPELRESKGERIRKRLLYIANVWKEGGYSCGNSDEIDDIIAWLEKQGEQKPIIDGILTATNYDKMFQNCNVPKFKVGDWVVYYRNDSSREVLQVYDIRDGRYYFTDNVHFSWSVKECDEKSHLWTIQDAKPGDVLYYENSGIEYIVMNKGINKYNNIDSYFRYNSKDGFDIGVPSVLSAESDIITPATKEQCDTLFAKMKEAGYEWLEETKVLKKIEQKSAEWSEEDEKMYRGVMAVCDVWSTATSFYPKENEDVERLKNWLKSLKTRVSQK